MLKTQSWSIVCSKNSTKIVVKALFRLNQVPGKSAPTQRAPDPSTGSGTAGGSRRVFRQFVWFEADSVKAAFPHPAHPRVTHTVGQLNE